MILEKQLVLTTLIDTIMKTDPLSAIDKQLNILPFGDMSVWLTSA